MFTLTLEETLFSDSFSLVPSSDDDSASDIETEIHGSVEAPIENKNDIEDVEAPIENTNDIEDVEAPTESTNDIEDVEAPIENTNDTEDAEAPIENTNDIENVEAPIENTNDTEDDEASDDTVETKNNSANEELIAKWGKWGFWDGAEDTRPNEDYCGEFPNCDIPDSKFPRNAWQADAV